MKHSRRAWLGTILFGAIGVFITGFGIAHWGESFGRRDLPAWVAVAVGIWTVIGVVATHRRRMRGHFDD